MLFALRGGTSDLVVRHEMMLGLIWGLGLAVIFALLPRSRPAREIRVALVLGLLLIVLTALSLLWAESAERAMVEVARVVGYIALLGLVAFAVSNRTWRAAAAGLAIAAGLVSFLAVAGRLIPDIVSFVGFDVFSSRRLLFPLGYWNAVAAWGAISMTMALSYSANHGDAGWRWIALASAPVSGMAVYLTYSRGGVIAALLGVALVVALSTRRSIALLHAVAALGAIALVILVVRSQAEVASGSGDNGGGFVLVVLLGVAWACGSFAARTGGRKQRVTEPMQHAWLGAGGAVIVALAMVLALGGSGASSTETIDGESSAQSADPSDRLTSLESSRFEIWESAGRAVASNPIGGIGAGGFEFWWNRDGAVDEALRNAHSLPLEVAAELGIPGLLILLGFLGTLLLGAGRARSQARSSGEIAAATAMLGAFVIFLFTSAIDWMWELPAVTLLALSAAVVACAAASAATRPSRSGAARRFAIGLGLISLGLTQIPGLVSNQRVRASQSLLELGDIENAREEAGEAIDAEPWAATPYSQRALASLELGDVDSAKRAAAEAYEREPTNWRHSLLLVQVQLAAGDTDAALDALARTRELSPLPEAAFDAFEVRIAVADALPVPPVADP